MGMLMGKYSFPSFLLLPLSLGWGITGSLCPNGLHRKLWGLFISLFLAENCDPNSQTVITSSRIWKSYRFWKYSDTWERGSTLKGENWMLTRDAFAFQSQIRRICIRGHASTPPTPSSLIQVRKPTSPPTHAPFRSWRNKKIQRQYLPH